MLIDREFEEGAKYLHFVQCAIENDYRDWRALWAKNASLKGKRDNPLMLYHGDETRAEGDVVEIHDPTDGSDTASTETLTTYTINSDKVFLRIQILDLVFLLKPRTGFFSSPEWGVFILARGRLAPSALFCKRVEMGTG